MRGNLENHAQFDSGQKLNQPAAQQRFFLKSITVDMLVMSILFILSRYLAEFIRGK